MSGKYLPISLFLFPFIVLIILLFVFELCCLQSQVGRFVNFMGILYSGNYNRNTRLLRSSSQCIGCDTEGGRRLDGNCSWWFDWMWNFQIISKQHKGFSNILPKFCI